MSPTGPAPAPEAAGTADAPAARIAALALPALVVLAAEPLYVLVDTAVVGHLGRVPLAAVAVGGTVMSVGAWLGTVMAYGTTGRSARRFGADDRPAAVAEGALQLWFFCALALDAVAIAAQSLIGAALGGGDVALARDVARRVTVAGGVPWTAC